MAFEMNTVITRVAYAVNYDINDLDARNHVELLIEAGLEDMRQAGVTQAVIDSDNKLLTSALIIFVNDNLNLNPGTRMTSPMYLANVDKLRGLVVQSESE